MGRDKHWTRRLLAAGGLGLVLMGCDRHENDATTGPTSVIRTGGLSRIVVNAAARALTPDGHFSLAVPAAQTTRLVSSADAQSLALAWAKQFGPFVRQQLEREHGAQIDITGLSVCPRPLFADTPYQDLPGDPTTPARNLFGPWWLVSLCTGTGEPAVSLGIAAYGTEIRMQEGRVVFPPFHGANFLAMGVRKGTTLPVSPERAAELAATTTGRRIADVPYLILAGRPYAPQAALWRVTLENPVLLDARESRRQVSTKEVFVGSLGREAPGLYVRAEGGPREAEWTHPAPRTTRSDPITQMRWRATLKADAAPAFEHAVVSQAAR